MRTFDSSPAVRSQTPLLIGMVSPSGAGKTYSSLRLATGIQRVHEGPIYFLDTEARRGLHYADRFKFMHVPFSAPFSPADYLEAIQYCVSKGAGTIIVDSLSLEHDGLGGVMEMHEAEIDRLAGDGADYKRRERVSMLAWQKPKAQRRKLINTMLQLPCHFILNFRAKEKLRIVKGRDPEQLGWQPIAGSEFIYELTIKFLFLPGANGVPVLQSEYEGERAMIKIPEQFRSMFDPARPRQVDEQLGEQLARWAAGGAATTATVDELVRGYDACSDAATLRTLEAQRGELWSKATAEQKTRLKSAAEAAKARVDQGAQPLPQETPDGHA